jgi:hypothetical protein
VYRFYDLPHYHHHQWSVIRHRPASPVATGTQHGTANRFKTITDYQLVEDRDAVFTRFVSSRCNGRPSGAGLQEYWLLKSQRKKKVHQA